MAVKRSLDIAASAALLVILLPALVVVGIAVRLDSPGPAIYRGRRVGLNGRPITVLKFRSMTHGADDRRHVDYVTRLVREGGDPTSEMFKLDDDPRITRLGRWLRRTSIDELPQLANVLLGTMSLVGPRPEVPQVLDAYEPWMFRRFACKPGMTGLWQVSGRASLSPRDMLRLDVEYVDTWSLRNDLRILALTPSRALSKGGTR
ncbi:MAG: sugar transferase [Ilumatobacteraceae bacterium]